VSKNLSDEHLVLHDALVLACAVGAGICGALVAGSLPMGLLMAFAVLLLGIPAMWIPAVRRAINRMALKLEAHR
jgi:hypothetical protein